jgi:hypothetical protein
MPVHITKLEQITLRELIAIAKLAYTGFNLRRPYTRVAVVEGSYGRLALVKASGNAILSLS